MSGWSRGTLLCAAVVLLLAGCTAQQARTPASRQAPAGTPAASSDAAAQRPAPEAAEAAKPQPSAAPSAAPPAEPPLADAPAGVADDASAPGPLDDGAAVFAALRAQLTTTDCRSDDRVVARWLSVYGRTPQRLAANLERVLPLLAHVLDRVRAAGLPGEFALLPIVESWYRTDARHAGTAGLWQFSATTARAYGLRVDATADQRLAPAPATEAALAHLTDLMARFGDWRLAAMAYNAGAYRLGRAHAADPSTPSAEQHRPAGLSMTTYEHLAKLQALACLVLEPGRVALDLPTAPFAPLTPRTLLAMGATPTAPSGDGRVHEVQRGDSLWAIAQRHGVALADLLRWNALDAEAVLRPGQRIRLSP